MERFAYRRLTSNKPPTHQRVFYEKIIDILKSPHQFDYFITCTCTFRDHNMENSIRFHTKRMKKHNFVNFDSIKCLYLAVYLYNM